MGADVTDAAWMVLPNQLVAVARHLERAQSRADVRTIVVWEDPVFYGDREGQAGFLSEKFELNKLRIAYQRMVVEFFYREICKEASKFGLQVEWIKVDELWDLGVNERYAQLHKYSTIYGYDAVDHLFVERMKQNKINIILEDENPLFLMTKQDMEMFIEQSGFRKKPKPLMRMAPLYNFMKEKMKILQSQKSLDTMNRDAFPTGGAKPPQPYLEDTEAAKTEIPGKTVEWLQASVFGKNPGPKGTDRELEQMLARLPINGEDAKRWFAKFLDERFCLFGPYEDAIVSGEPWMYHSGISMFVNFGLLEVEEVVKMTRAHYEKLTTSEKKKQLPSYEGFIRQLLGWRELCRVYYEYVPMETRRKNVFKLKGKLGPEYYMSWDKPTSKLPPVVKEAVGDAWNGGYLHHIRRLMIMSNWMTLSGISPDQVFKWMTETTLDTWDWVMHLNVYGMGTWSDGGVSLRKPYISSAAYVKKMTNTKGKQSWEDEWTQMFRDFLEDHRDVIKHTELARFLKKQ